MLRPELRALLTHKRPMTTTTTVAMAAALCPRSRVSVISDLLAQASESHSVDLVTAGKERFSRSCFKISSYPGTICIYSPFIHQFDIVSFSAFASARRKDFGSNF
jgi:hypothetical protein